MKDKYGREIDYLRISITDRCNLRCIYCMPEDGICQVSHKEILTYDEIQRICSCITTLGIKKIKLTGGEPLTRKNCSTLVRMLKELPEIEKVTLTTNGMLLKEQIQELAEAGIDNINISLDTVDKAKFEKITRRKRLFKVLEGLEEALKYPNIGLKINCVPVVEEPENLVAVAKLAKEYPIHVRFIEMMPIGYGNIPQSISNEELKEKIMRYYGNLTEDFRIYGNGPAVYYSIEGFKGNIGFISAIHGKFCNLCNRIRMTSTGDIKPCLCYEQRWALKPALRMEHKEKRQESIQKILIESIKNKPQMHCFENVKSVSEKHFMGQIGG